MDDQALDRLIEDLGLDEAIQMVNVAWLVRKTLEDLEPCVLQDVGEA